MPQLNSISEKDVRNLRERIEKLNLYEIKVIGDGNCQFRAIAGSLYNDPELHSSVRKAIVRWLLLNENYSPSDDGTKLSDFIDRDTYPTWKDFCEYMSRDQVWGDHLTLIAAAEVFNTNIYIISSIETDDLSKSITVIVPKSKKAKYHIFLSHYHDYHFNYCVPLQSKL